MNKILKFLAWPIKNVIGIGYSKCHSCHYPWNMVEGHTIPINGYSGIFAVCEDCWNTKSDDELIRAHNDLYDSWILGDKYNAPLSVEAIGFTREEMLESLNDELKKRNKK